MQHRNHEPARSFLSLGLSLIGRVTQVGVLLLTVIAIWAVFQLRESSPSSTVTGRATTVPKSTPTLAARSVQHNPGVSDLLRHRPAPEQVVEVDAYFSGVGALPFSSPPHHPTR